MSDIVLGERCRRNFGISSKYSSDLDSVYKGYIDALEQQMILVTYGTDINNCTFTNNYNLLLTEDTVEINGETRYLELEQALKMFCLQHNVSVNFSRFNSYISATFNMLRSYQATHS